MNTAGFLEVLDERGLTTAAMGPGESLLDVLARARSGGMDSPCGGRGRCGKCRVRAAGPLSPPSNEELRFLSAMELKEGWRLACQARRAEGSEAPIRVEFPSRGAASILTEGPKIDFRADPPATRIRLSLQEPTLEKQVSDEERLLVALADWAAARRLSGFPTTTTPRRLTLGALRALAQAARGKELSVLVAGEEILEVSMADAKLGAGFGIGVDIGTTTIACYLVDLESAQVLGTRSALNEQARFGADVISRIAAASASEEGLAELRDRIGRQIGAMARGLLAERGAETRDLLTLAFAGNTTMMHLLAGVHPDAIAASPFPPVFTRTRSFKASDLGLDLPETCSAWLLPGVSAYVGADIVSGIAALGMAESPGNFLLLDIGTNGEIALGGASGILCCATAAGPAFEGAGIEMGMGGTEGAIDAIWRDGEGLAWSTLGNAPARGLCGSGVLDALAVFLEAGLIDDSGRIIDVDEAALLRPGLAALRSEAPSGPRLAIGDSVYLSQADVRSLQLATAAIAAGIDILVARAGIDNSAVDRVYLAGGFGSYLDLRSALRVGLIPAALGDKVVVVGNSSGAGAVAACLSKERLEACDVARKRCTYIELSSSPEFNELFVDHMFFPVPL